MNQVIIVGGGPAGAAMGCYLSMAGIENAIFESAMHPRPHVGESMVTSSTRVFKEIGFLETMEREGFVKKYGASWHAPENRGKVPVLDAVREFIRKAEGSEGHLLMAQLAKMPVDSLPNR
jgi:2-polyprenyl-6-methoxyphenol hydroxylase-like FAD-dependent oxidoreductase